MANGNFAYWTQLIEVIVDQRTFTESYHRLHREYLICSFGNSNNMEWFAKRYLSGIHCADYSLTEAGKAILPILGVIDQWGTENKERIKAIDYNAVTLYTE